MRHSLLVRDNDPGRGFSINSHARDYPRNSQVALHAHASDQLVYASCGVMEIASRQSLWLLPPHFGLWVPARTEHSIRMPQPVSMRTLYLRPGIFTQWTGCTVFHVSSLLRELIFEIVRMQSLRQRNRIHSALSDVLVSQLKRATPIPTALAVPLDSRALALAQSVLESPADRRSLADSCQAVGASVRTVQRAWRREVGLDFESWRRQVRLMRGIQMMVAGMSIKEVADAVGYRDTSTFIDLFRDTFGRPPKSWLLSLTNRGAPS